MKSVLDTNICIHLFRGQFNLIEKFKEIDLQDCAISEITLAELPASASVPLVPTMLKKQ